MANIRTSRDVERRMVRDDQTRSAESIVSYTMKYVDPLSLPPGVARDGYSYYWAPVHIRNCPIYKVEELCAEGWELVPSSRAPGVSMDPFRRNPLAGEYIFKGDLVLMEAPEHLVKGRQQARWDFNKRKTRAIKGASDDSAFAARQGFAF